PRCEMLTLPWTSGRDRESRPSSGLGAVFDMSKIRVLVGRKVKGPAEAGPGAGESQGGVAPPASRTDAGGSKKRGPRSALDALDLRRHEPGLALLLLDLPRRADLRCGV